MPHGRPRRRSPKRRMPQRAFEQILPQMSHAFACGAKTATVVRSPPLINTQASAGCTSSTTRAGTVSNGFLIRVIRGHFPSVFIRAHPWFSMLR